MKLPSNWDRSALSRVMRTGRTITYGIVQPGEHKPDGVLVIRSQDYSTGWCGTDQLMRVSREVEKPYIRSRVDQNDILITVVGANIGKLAIVPKCLHGANISRSVARISPDPNEVDSRFLFQFLAGGITRLLHLNSNGGAQPVLNLDDLREFEIPLPPLPEQRKIADVLTTWDEALTQLDALIEAQERRKKALMQQLLTGRRRLKGFSKPWITAKLGTLFKERVEQGRIELPLLSITADRGIVPREDVAKRDSSSEDKSKYLRIAPGDIGYNTMRMWQGVSALSALEGIVSPAYTICTPTDRIDGRFTAHFFKLRHTVHLFHRYSQGLVDDTLNLKFPSFAVIEVTVPGDLKEQRQIAALLDTADQQLTLLRTQRTALDQQKRGLMQRLLTGKLQVIP